MGYILSRNEPSDEPGTIQPIEFTQYLSMRYTGRLADAGMVRRLGLHERAAYFTLVLPDQHRDYLICTECGTIDPIDAPCPVHELENEIRSKTGYQNLYHELEFFGICPKCA